MSYDELSPNERILEETVNRVKTPASRKSAEEGPGILGHIMEFAAVIAVVGTAAHLCLDVAERVQGKDGKKKEK